jgi:hypothetical protein
MKIYIKKIVLYDVYFFSYINNVNDFYFKKIKIN